MRIVKNSNVAWKLFQHAQKRDKSARGRIPPNLNNSKSNLAEQRNESKVSSMPNQQWTCFSCFPVLLVQRDHQLHKGWPQDMIWGSFHPFFINRDHCYLSEIYQIADKTILNPSVCVIVFATHWILGILKVSIVLHVLVHFRLLHLLSSLFKKVNIEVNSLIGFSIKVTELEFIKLCVKLPELGKECFDAIRYARGCVRRTIDNYFSELNAAVRLFV